MDDQNEVPVGELGPEVQVGGTGGQTSGGTTTAALPARVQVVKPLSDSRGPDLVWFGHSETIGQVVGALSKAQGTFAKIKRTQHADIESRRTGAKYGYDYAPLAEVLEAVTPALSKNGLTLMFFPLVRSASVVVRTLLAHESGEYFHNDLTATSEGTDPRSIGSCVTYLSRYGAQAICGVAPSWDDDGEAGSTPQSGAQGNAPLPQPGERRPTGTAPNPQATPTESRTASTRSSDSESASVAPHRPGAIRTFTGTIAEVDAGTGRVTLAGGEKCGTRNKEYLEAAQRLQKDGRKVELTVKNAEKPDRYLPSIVEIQILQE